MNLRELRRQHNYTQEEVAISNEISRVYLTQLENGTRRASPDVAARLGQFYNIPKSQWWDVFYG